MTKHFLAGILRNEKKIICEGRLEKTMTSLINSPWLVSDSYYIFMNDFFLGDFCLGMNIFHICLIIYPLNFKVFYKSTV